MDLNEKPTALKVFIMVKVKFDFILKVHCSHCSQNFVPFNKRNTFLPI